MELEQAIKAALDGRAVLFVGAGFSTGALNLNGECFPTASEFSAALCKEMGRPENLNLSLTSDMYMTDSRFGIQALIHKLDRAYRAKNLGESSEDYMTICGLPWIRIYTTNYDNVCELACSQQGLIGIPKTLSDSAKDHFDEMTVVHLNGYIDRLSAETLRNEFKLSTTSYFVEDFQKSDWKELFQAELISSQAIIFIGVSFDYDIDLQRIIANGDATKDKIIFIDRPLEPEDDEEVLNYYKKRFGTVYNIGYAAFAKKVEEIKVNYEPNSQPLNFYSFQKIHFTRAEVRKCTSQDGRDLLSVGRIDRGLIPYALKDAPYIFERTVEEKLISLLKSESEYNCIVVTSELANGKTCLIEHAAYRLQESGVVFSLRDYSDSTIEELKEILSIRGRKYIFIENYSFQYEALRLFKNVDFDASCIKLVLTARSAIYDTTSYMISNLTGIPDNLITELNIDQLSDQDIEQLVGLMDYTGVWEGLRNSTLGFKKAEIKKRYHARFYNVLLGIMNSKQVSDKILELYDTISKDAIAMELLAGLCISNLISLDFSLSDLLSILEIQLPQATKQSQEVRQLVDFHGDSIKVKSTVLCKFLIHQHKMIDTVKEVLLKINQNAEACSHPAKVDSIRTALISASNINLIFPPNEEATVGYLAEYYNALKGFDCYKNNQFFWLQYAMACMDIKDYCRAKEYLDIAYEIVERDKPGFDSYQIDTQAARYHLESVLCEGNSKDVFGEFQIAHTLLIQVIRRGKGQKHLVFKRLMGYQKLYEVCGANFTNSQRGEMKKACEEFISQCNSYRLQQTLSKNQTRITEGAIQSLKQLQESLIRDIARSMGEDK